jgi:hypothetical protein
MIMYFRDHKVLDGLSKEVAEEGGRGTGPLLARLQCLWEVGDPLPSDGFAILMCMY